MSRAIRYLVAAAASTACAVFLLPGVAHADNCGSLTDCYNTARAALAALVGLSVLFGVVLSIGLDFVPGVGTAKGIIEAIIGKDLVTGQELAWWERVLGVVPILGGVAGVVGGVSRGARALDDVGDLGRAVDRASDLPYSGSRYVDDAQSPRAARAYDEIRGTPGDTGRIAGNTGIGQNMLDKVKDHLFVREHNVPTGPGQTATGRFAPLDEIGDLWQKATDGTLNADEAARFQRLVAHEYVESRLMDAGMPYRSSHPDAFIDGVNFPTARHHGAHDLAPLADAAQADPFRHWPGLGREHPGITIAPDLSNLDQVIDLILRGAR